MVRNDREMLGGQHRNDESDTDLSVRGEHTNANDRAFSRYATGAPRGGQHPQKKLLQWLTPLEIRGTNRSIASDVEVLCARCFEILGRRAARDTSSSGELLLSLRGKTT